jgi:hypothetical protein
MAMRKKTLDEYNQSQLAWNMSLPIYTSCHRIKEAIELLEHFMAAENLLAEE